MKAGLQTESVQHPAQISGPRLMTHFLSSVTDWNHVKREKKMGENKGHDQIKSDWALLFVAKQLGVDSTSSLFSQHVQDVLWHRKPYLKVDEREGRSPVQDRGDVRFCCSESEADSWTQHVTSYASPPLSVPAPCNLFACPCQRRLRSSCSAHSELIDPSSAGKNISLCHPPLPHFELHNLPSLSFSVKKKKKKSLICS